MEMKLKLTKEDLEYILYEHYNAKGLDPEIKLNKDLTVDIALVWDFESFDSRF